MRLKLKKLNNKIIITNLSIPEWYDYIIKLLSLE